MLLHKKVLIAAVVGWLLPAAMLVMNYLLVFDPNQELVDFEKRVFLPSVVEVFDDSTKNRKGTEQDYFELWIESQEGDRFFIRNPEPEPIKAYRQAVPADEILELHFTETFEGNRIVNLVVQSTGAVAISLQTILEAERQKRLVINLATLGMFLLGNALLAWNYWNLKRVAQRGS